MTWTLICAGFEVLQIIYCRSTLKCAKKECALVLLSGVLPRCLLGRLIYSVVQVAICLSTPAQFYPLLKVGYQSVRLLNPPLQFRRCLLRVFWGSVVRCIKVRNSHTSWWSVPFIITNGLLRLVTFFRFKFIWSEVRKPLWILTLFAWYVFSHLFTFNLFVSWRLIRISCTSPEWWALKKKNPVQRSPPFDQIVNPFASGVRLIFFPRAWALSSLFLLYRFPPSALSGYFLASHHNFCNHSSHHTFLTRFLSGCSRASDTHVTLESTSDF